MWEITPSTEAERKDAAFTPAGKTVSTIDAFQYVQIYTKQRCQGPATVSITGFNAKFTCTLSLLHINGTKIQATGNCLAQKKLSQRSSELMLLRLLYQRGEIGNDFKPTAQNAEEASRVEKLERKVAAARAESVSEIVSNSLKTMEQVTLKIPDFLQKIPENGKMSLSRIVFRGKFTSACLGILTTNKLPLLPPIRFDANIELLFEPIGAVQLEEKQLALLEQFHQQYVSLIYTAAVASAIDKYYLLVPLQLEQIDWQLAEEAFSVKRAVNMDSLSADAMLYAAYNKQFYIAEAARPDLTPGSPFAPRPKQYTSYADYFEKQWHITLSDLQSPLLQALPYAVIPSSNYVASQPPRKRKRGRTVSSIILIPELTCVHRLQRIYFETAKYLGWAMWELENVLRCIELQDVTSLSVSELTTVFSSSGAHRETNNELLEFLGDSVLQLYVSEQLYHLYPEMQEGDLTKLRSKYVANNQLYLRAKELQLHRCMLTKPFGAKHYPFAGFKSADAANSNLYISVMSSKTIADTFEALVGAIYLAREYAAAAEFSKRILAPAKILQPPAVKVDRVEWMKNIEAVLGYEFSNLAFLASAFKHPSLTADKLPNYQRMEFLGDAILQLHVTHQLVAKNPQESAGNLTRHRQGLTSNVVLVKVGHRYKLAQHLQHSSPALAKAIATGEPHPINSNLVEAVIAAVYLDALYLRRDGLDASGTVIERLFT